MPARGRLDDASHQRAADVAPPSIDGPFHAGIPRRAQARWQRRRYCPNELRVAHFAVHGTARGWRQDSTIDQFLAACPVNLALTGVLQRVQCAIHEQHRGPEFDCFMTALA